MTIVALPVREQREPTRVAGVNLVDRQWSELDSLAARAGLNRSEVLRWLIDLALPLAREAMDRHTVIPAPITPDVS